jgi:hypothetical protein
LFFTKLASLFIFHLLQIGEILLILDVKAGMLKKLEIDQNFDLSAGVLLW